MSWEHPAGDAFKGKGKGKGFGFKGKGKGFKGRPEPWNSSKPDEPVDLTTAIDELHTTCMDLMADDGMLNRAWGQVKAARIQQQQALGVTPTPVQVPTPEAPPRAVEPTEKLTADERQSRSQSMLNRSVELLKAAPGGDCRLQGDELLRDPVIREGRKGVATIFKKWLQMYPETFRIDEPEPGKTQYYVALHNPLCEPPVALDTPVPEGKSQWNKNKKRNFNVAFTPPFGSF